MPQYDVFGRQNVTGGLTFEQMSPTQQMRYKESGNIYKPTREEDARVDPNYKSPEQKKAEAKLAREKQLYADAKAGRDQDLAEGRARGQQLFGENTLGRLQAGRASEVADIIARRNKALSGPSAEEQNAQRAGYIQQLGSQQQAAARQLAISQARSGVRGGLASSQQAKLLSDMQGQGAEQERQLYLNQEQQKRDALSALEESIGRARSEEMGREQFNIGQAGKEKFGQLSTELGFGSLGAGERASVMQRLLGEDQAEAAKEAASKSGGKK